MSFDLRIRFAGICLFVPEPGPNARMPEVGGKLHVLLPFVKHHHTTGGGHVVEHLPRLLYDTAYETRRARAFTRELECVKLNHFALELAGLGADTLTISLPDEIASIRDVASPVSRVRVSDTPGPEVAARVTLHQGRVTDYPPGAKAKLRDEENFRRMTAQVEWTIRGIEGDSLPRQVLRGLDGAADTSIPELFPIGDTIHLQVFNAPASLLPGAIPQTGDASTDHFEGLYEIAPSQKRPVPIVQKNQILVSNRCAPPAILPGEQALPDALKCMPGQTTLA
jgi:hypothetical protein